MKVAILFSRLSGYLTACLEAYLAHVGAELLVFARPAEKNAPFAAGCFSILGEILDRSKFGQEQIEERVRVFKPTTILVSGWNDPVYNRVCRRLKASGVPVISGLDNQWKGSLRQRMAALLAPWYIQRFIDVFWVAGDRQRQFAHRLGYRGVHCWDGFYSCDWKRFAHSSPMSLSTRSNRFLFVGRYVEEKGIRDLAAAYAIYRTKVDNAWPLDCAGRGDLVSLLTKAGAKDCGFVQPDLLPELMHDASAFVLPSVFEPWGVAIHEAAACGLPLIVSKACGASVHLVRNGYNGYITETGNPNSLASALIRIHTLSEVERHEFGRRSFDLSKQYSPEKWDRTLREGLAMLRPSPAA